MEAATASHQEIKVGTAVFSESRGWCRVTSMISTGQAWLEPDNGRKGFFVSIEEHIRPGLICDR